MNVIVVIICSKNEKLTLSSDFVERSVSRTRACTFKVNYLQHFVMATLLQAIRTSKHKKCT